MFKEEEEGKIVTKMVKEVTDEDYLSVLALQNWHGANLTFQYFVAEDPAPSQCDC